MTNLKTDQPLEEAVPDNFVDRVSVFIGTWNLGNAVPPTDLREWILPGHDIYAIGIQEGAYPCGSDEQNYWKEDWTEKLLLNINIDEYALIASNVCLCDVLMSCRGDNVGD